MIRRLAQLRQRLIRWIDEIAEPGYCCTCGRPAADPCDDMTWWRYTK